MNGMHIVNSSVLSMISATMNSISVNNVYMNSDVHELVGSITPPKFSSVSLSA